MAEVLPYNRGAHEMKRLIVAGCGLLLVAGITGGVVLWRSSGMRVFHDHTMGESAAEFARIEAKLNKIDLDKCDDIGRPKKRDFCDELVALVDGKRDSVNVEGAQGQGAQGQFVGTLKGDKLEGGKLFRLIVGPAGRYDLALKELTGKFGPPQKTGEYKLRSFDNRGDAFAVWFVKPHTLVALKSYWDDPGRNSQIHYTYVDNAPWADEHETPTPSSQPRPEVSVPSEPPSVGGSGPFSPEAVKAIKSGDGYAVLPLLKPTVRKVFGRDERLFFASAQTFLPSANVTNGAAIFEFCRAHACGDDESILFVDTNEGKAAGVLIHEGNLYPYPGDYGVQANWPKPLKDWWKEHTNTEVKP